MIPSTSLSLALCLLLTELTQASDHQRKPQPHLHQRQIDFSYGTCYLANDVRKASELISHTTIELSVCGPTSSSSTNLSAATTMSAQVSSTLSVPSSTATSEASASSVKSLIASPTASPTSVATINSTSTISSDSTATITPDANPVLSFSEFTSSSVNSTMSTATPDSTPTLAPVLAPNPILPSLIGNILVRLSTNGTAIGNLSACPDNGDISGSTYYYYSNDSAKAIQFSFTPSPDPLVPISIQFASSIQSGFNYLGIEDNNSGQIGTAQTGGGTIAAITQGGGANMFDTSNSFDGATNSSQATIWTLDPSLVMSAQFYNVGGAGSTNISVVAFDDTSAFSYYSYLTVIADGSPIPQGGYGVYFTFVPM